MSRPLTFSSLQLGTLLCLALAVLTPAPTQATRIEQTRAGAAAATAVTITGSVVDATLSPLSGVVVTLEQGGRTVARTTTGADGTFRLAGVAPGEYRVRAALAGFPTLVRDVRVPTSPAEVNLPLVLARPADAMPAAKSDESASMLAAVPAPPPASFPAANGVSATPPSGRGGGGRGGGLVAASPMAARQEPFRQDWPAPSTASYAHLEPNRFHATREDPLSTFGADVDTASYANVRRFLTGGQLPPPDAVRVEEFVNAFRFEYAEPRGGRPLALTTEIGDCPWAPAHELVLIGARAKASTPREIAGRNIVLLVDVSGSMAPPQRLPLIKTALGLFVDTLRPDDRLAIVTYAGTSGVALPSTPARNRGVIQRAIDGLSAGGSTNGAQGLIMAYRTASDAFIPGGVNRVILATDGDFNVGIVNPRDLVRLIEREKASGVFLSVFGVGDDNLKDSTMEMLADRGNGHYAYLDSLQEARRVLVREADATLETVAKDVKFQVEFNPAAVTAWKLIGYEDRRLGAEDFNDDRQDGGEMGAGHTVTVLYEVIPAGTAVPDVGRVSERPAVDPLKYQAPSDVRPMPRPAAANAGRSAEWLTVKARYKSPEGADSELIEQPVRAGGRAQFLPLASAVAEFAGLLRDGTRDPERWDALARRVNRLEPPATLAADTAAFKELVAIAEGLARLRGGR